MATTLDQAKSIIRMSLDLADGNADAVAAAINKSQRDARLWATDDTNNFDHYAMLRLALSDVTGDAGYRR